MFETFLSISIITIPLLAIILWLIFKKYFKRKTTHKLNSDILARKYHNILLVVLFINAVVIACLHYLFEHPTYIKYFFSLYFVFHMVLGTYIKLLYAEASDVSDNFNKNK